MLENENKNTNDEYINNCEKACQHTSYSFSDRCKNLEGNAIREIFKLLAQPDIISFAGGMPAGDTLPKTDIKTIIAELLSSDKAVSLLQYGATEGYLPYLLSGIEYVKRVGINNISLDHILGISGGQQGIDLACKAFLNKGDKVLVENPTYIAVLHILKTYEATAIPVKSSDAGIDLVDLEQKIIEHNPKMLYLVPTFSNPTGRTIDLEKRKALAVLASKYNIIILEDNPYAELRYDGTALPAIKHFDKTGNIVYITSFSKTISPGMRIGLAVADPLIIRKLTIGKQATDVHTSTLSQAVVSEYLNRGLLSPSLEKNIPMYRKKRDVMLSAIEQHFPKCAEFNKPQGGLFIWVTLPESIDVSNKIFTQAISRRVAYVSGDAFHADGSGKNTLRLNFSNATEDNIKKGIAVLGDILKEHTAVISRM
ncbi:MAG: PLP-dependent aminotransferase family protein [Christensenellaceae bacterium]|jgi:2-aminoadipate transaminase|nr:PLP-dependent aminotransferase family protein [Christensenellaceae bacterium]